MSAEPAPPDALTQVLAALRFKSVQYERLELSQPWSFSYEARPSARFYFVATGQAWLRAEGEAPVELLAGDAVLLPRGAAHTLASGPDLEPVCADCLVARGVLQDVQLLTTPGEGALQEPPSHVLFAGSLEFTLSAEHPVLAMMPAVIRAGELARRDPTVPALLEAMEREIRLARIGACGIMARLSDVLCASVIRAWLECTCTDGSTWPSIVRHPPLGRVLAAIHANPENDWPVPSLARLMGASRSSFAQTFKDAVGESPAKYVTRVRMFEAQRWIAAEGMRVSVAADRLGYESEAAFSRAYKRVVGRPPSAERQAHPATA